MNKILRVFLDTDMRNQHDGLEKIATKNKVSLIDLDQGSHVIFVNTRCNKIKIYSSNGVLSYMKKDTGGKLDLNMIEMIPHSFNQTGAIDWNKAAKLSLEKKLGLEKAND